VNDRSRREIISFYSEIAPDYEARVAAEARPAFPRVITELLADIPQDELSMLDLGCGPGSLRRYTRFKSYAGIDLSAEMLALAEGYETFQGDVLEVLRKLPDASYDGAVSVSALYFMAPEVVHAIVTELERVTRRFWLVTLDGITPKLMKEYADGGIDVWNHREIELPVPVRRVNEDGWSASTDERIQAEYVLRVKE
jgi:SAM-dependent methyltransferase